MGKRKAKKAAKKPSGAQRTANAAVIDPAKAFHAAREAALALPEERVKVARMSAGMARVLAVRAATALAPYLAQSHKLAQSIDAKRIASLPSLGHAYEFAVGAVPAQRSNQAIARALSRVQPVRRAALAFLESAVFCGLVNAGHLRAIKKGHGKLDVAHDAVAIAGVFDDQARALAGKHPFTAAQLAILRDDGAWLTDHVKPAGALKGPKPRAPEALMRDRIAALLEDAYAEAEKLAVVVWGFAEMREHLPNLRWHRGRGRPKTV